MARRGAQKGIYRRGQFWLDWDRTRDGGLRSPFLAIWWYDPERGRIRSASTGTAEVEAGRRALDAHYLATVQGEAVCPTCGQPRRGASCFVTTAIANYLDMHGEGRPSAPAIRARLAHVAEYVANLPSAAVRCTDVDEAWVGRFRAWAIRQPIVSPKGAERQRSHATVEGSVRQLSAAINMAYSRRDTSEPARFKAKPPMSMSKPPELRLDIDGLADAFRFAMADPRRAALHRFLIFSTATLARPDAAYDFSVEPSRRQWNRERRVIALNPRGRVQTKKYRPAVIAPRQLVPLLNAATGRFVGPASIRTSWEAMAEALDWPGEGEAGSKLVRRSVAQILRDSGEVPDDQLELQLGHRALSSVSDLYAAFKPQYLQAVTTAIEGLIDAIEARAPGAFHRTFTGATVHHLAPVLA